VTLPPPLPLLSRIQHFDSNGLFITTPYTRHFRPPSPSEDTMASLYTPTLTYNPTTDPLARRANHYQLERSPGDGFVYEAMADPLTGNATPFHHFDSLIIATSGKSMSFSSRHLDA
jgi:hypothetical protein